MAFGDLDLLEMVAWDRVKLGTCTTDLHWEIPNIFIQFA